MYIREDDHPNIKLNRLTACDEKFVSLLSPTDWCDVGCIAWHILARLFLAKSVVCTSQRMITRISSSTGLTACDEKFVSLLSPTDLCDVGGVAWHILTRLFSCKEHCLYVAEDDHPNIKLNRADSM